VYKDLPHPPSGYLCTPTLYSVAPRADNNPDSLNSKDRPLKRVKYASRSEDGSGYNPLFPALGKAGEPYARSVPSLHFTPASSLPDPGLIFDTLLKREEGKFVEHPGGISSVRVSLCGFMRLALTTDQLFFAFANLIIHTAFNTNCE
jgi:linoleate 10R-lipoxygenase